MILCAPAAAARPNVLIVLADDLGYSDLGCYGGEVPTPNLDRLAAAGVRFSACYNSARCCPTRASLMTGLYPHQTGIGSFATDRPNPDKGPAHLNHLNDRCVTLAELLGAAGYSTSMVGKWHMNVPGPIARGFERFYGYIRHYAKPQWKPSEHRRLPEGTPEELRYAEGEFYATDVFTDYALEFLRQARDDGRPWFLYLAHSSPHFPIQAPAESIDRHVDTYRRGWDALRAERLERMKRLGLIDGSLELPPRSEVPVDGPKVTNGYSGEPNPAWDDLPADRREDLARRMATYAAMVDHVDRGVGRLLADLEANGELDNTLIVFTSDNGACYEWGPFGFDGPSRQGVTKLHRGDELGAIDQPGSYHAYGSAWAMLCNTPLAMYKHFCHEGGVRSPLIVHWPARVQHRGDLVRYGAHVMDVVPTVCAATGAAYPAQHDGHDVQPLEGVSLLPALAGEALPDRRLFFEHQGARGVRDGDWKLVWGKRQPDKVRWELYNLADDVAEQRDLAAEHTALVDRLAADWLRWARRVNVYPFFLEDDATSARE